MLCGNLNGVFYGRGVKVLHQVEGGLVIVVNIQLVTSIVNVTRVWTIGVKLKKKRFFNNVKQLYTEE